MCEDTNDRFDIVYEQYNFMSSYKIIVDKHTGVQYLCTTTGNVEGITPLLDKEGKVFIDLNSVERE